MPRKSKLSDDDVRVILAMPRGSDWDRMADTYAISVSYIHDLRQGKFKRALRIRDQLMRGRAA